jgi:hypothetical protein
MAHPSAFEWDAIRPTFENLYVDQKMKLEKVQEILEESGFSAT